MHIFGPVADKFSLNWLENKILGLLRPVFLSHRLAQIGFGLLLIGDYRR
jgi:hypothetical protein